VETSDLALNEDPTMDTDQIAKLHSDHTKELATHWDAQLATLMNAFKLSTQTLSFPASNRIPLPKFSGDGSKDANEFLAIFEGIARFYKLNKDQKIGDLPVVFDGECKCVVQHYPGLSGNIFESLAGALKTAFHSDSDVGPFATKVT